MYFLTLGLFMSSYVFGHQGELPSHKRSSRLGIQVSYVLCVCCIGAGCLSFLPFFRSLC